MKKINLFCIPYAGSSATYFSRWKKTLNTYINVVPLELAGRGTRYKTPFYNNFYEAVDDLYSIIEQRLDDSEYAFFGHSLGSLIAYELCKKIKLSIHRQPSYIFFSGRSAPCFTEENKIIYQLPEEEFKNEVLKYGGVPDGLFDDKEMASIFIPILRADFKSLYTYDYSSKPEKLNCDFSVLYGSNDATMKGNINEWKNYTSMNCKIHEINGGHFFIHEDEESIISLINNTI